MKIKHILCTLLFLAISCTTLASITEDSCFNTTAANKEFDDINITLSTQNLNKKSIKNAINKLSRLQEKSTECSTTTTENLRLLTKNNTVEIDKEKKAGFLKEISEYNDFSMRTEKAISALRETIRKSNVNKLFKSEPPIWTLFSGAEKTTSITAAKPSIELPSERDLYILSCILILSVLFGTYLRYTFSNISKQHDEIQTKQYLESWCFYSLPLTILSLISLFFLVLDWYDSTYPQLSNLSYSSSIYIFILLMLSLLFPTIKPQDDTKIQLYNTKRNIHFNLKILATFIYAGVVSVIFVDSTNIGSHIINIITASYLALLTLFIFRTCVISIRILALKSAPPWTQILLRSLLYLAVLSMLGLIVLGYHNLTIFIIKSSLLTFLSYYLFLFYFFCSEFIFSHLQESKYKLSRSIKKSLDIPLHKKIMGAIVIRLGLTILATLLFIISILTIWGVSAQHISNLKESIIEGFNYYGLNIEPLRIIFGIFTFGIIAIIFNIFSGRFAYKRRLQQENKESQITLSSVINYIGISIAVLMALLVAGFNFTGLAIIAGALSVGIGLGLQTIVNNFICGLILMIEKPIKPGDRIIVNGVEGIVKKIRPRSTQVSLLSKEDVIFPNAELINSPVTNFMFRDPLWRVTCKVGVAYGSDTDLVKTALLEVAANNQEVLDESPYQPIVLFRDFGNSSLTFELWCTINNVNRKYYIESDLNHAIDNAFRKHHITIAFPQRDVHIKEVKKD